VNTTRTVGLALSAVATVLWVVAAVALLTTSPEDGVNIGGALLALLALPLSVGATVTLLVSRGEAARHGMPEPHPSAHRIAAGLGIASIAGLCGSTVLGQLGSFALGVAAMVLLATGIAAFVASSALFALPRSRRS
jgi:hypothetical protein